MTTAPQSLRVGRRLLAFAGDSEPVPLPHERFAWDRRRHRKARDIVEGRPGGGDLIARSRSQAESRITGTPAHNETQVLHSEIFRSASSAGLLSNDFQGSDSGSG